MAKDKRSFFERLTGSVSLSDEEENRLPEPESKEENWINNTPEEGELNVDVYQSQNDITIKTMVAGVKPEDLDVAISRDMVTIKGKRDYAILALLVGCALRRQAQGTGRSLAPSFQAKAVPGIQQFKIPVFVVRFQKHK